MSTRNALRALIGFVAAILCSVAWSAATIVIQNGDSAGEGFNDPTPVSPVGGNSGTTLGQQRLIAFLSAANIWGATLTSAAPIVVAATFDPLSCTATTAVLGSAGPKSVWRDFTGAPFAGTWFHSAQANARFGADLDGGTDYEIGARFNSNLGATGCLTGSPFYLGLDSNEPAGQVDLVAVMLHELAHGLGFSTTTNGATGAQLSDGSNAAGYPSVYDRFLYDNTQNLLWSAMTDAQRATSAINLRQVVWLGANVANAVPEVLESGGPKMSVLEPADVAGEYVIGTATFGPPLTSIDLTRRVVPVIQNGALSRACTPFSTRNKRLVRDRFALVLRGGACGVKKKVRNAQAAGAAGVIVIHNVANEPPPDVEGTATNINIPTAVISAEDGITLLEAIDAASPAQSPVTARLFGDPSQFAGADAAGRVFLYTPSTFIPGLSVAHWDTSAAPALLMQPPTNPDLSHQVTPPADLTFPVLLDIGW